MEHKKVIITGGTSGIGLELNTQLSKSNEVLSISRSNGFDFDSSSGIENAIQEIKKNNPDFLFLNSGVGSFTRFDEVNLGEIQKLINVNLNSNIYFISQLKSKLKNGLKIVVTLSTASYINGAFEALYNASKKALKEYIISVNTELKDEGINNLIFIFVPHKINGTLMTSKKNIKSEELSGMVSDLLLAIDSRKDFYIPKYDEIYKNVFEDYKNDPYEQGKKSINYKRGRDE